MACEPERGLDMPTSVLSFVGTVVGTAVGASACVAGVHAATTAPIPATATPLRKSRRVKSFLTFTTSSFLENWIYRYYVSFFSHPHSIFLSPFHEIYILIKAIDIPVI